MRREALAAEVLTNLEFRCTMRLGSYQVRKEDDMAMDGEVWIRWESMSLEDTAEAEDTYFYALRRGNAVLYIGIAYDQHVADEVWRTIERLGMDSRGLYVCLGYVIKATFGRITRQIIGDVECCLICALKPPYNTHCEKSYTGDRNLIIHNRGCIEETVKCCIRKNPSYCKNKGCFVYRWKK